MQPWCHPRIPRTCTHLDLTDVIEVPVASQVHGRRSARRDPPETDPEPQLSVQLPRLQVIKNGSVAWSVRDRGRIRSVISGDSAIPLLEFDEDTAAYVQPQSMVHAVDAPRAAVACFFPEVVKAVSAGGRRMLTLPSREPLWEIEYQGQRLTVFYPGIGAALAGYSLERAIAAGCHAIVACGAAGAIIPGLTMGHHVISVTRAVRDEGTSFHYLPPGREVAADPQAVEILTRTAVDRGLPHLSGLTWTTDGFFRETPARVKRRREEGCITVEMEAAALIAIARFRGVLFGQYLYAADDLSGEVWEDRAWRDAFDVRRLLFDLAAESALALQAESRPPTYETSRRPQ